MTESLEHSHSLGRYSKKPCGRRLSPFFGWQGIFRSLVTALRSAADSLIARDRFGLSVEIGILVVLFLCPLFMGGRHPLGRMTFVSTVFLTAIAWSFGKVWTTDQSVRISCVAILPLLGLLLVIGQLVPLPDAVLRHVSPQLQNILPMWAENGQIGRWSVTSLSPRETQVSLTVYLSYVVLWVILVDRTRTVEDCKRYIRLVAMSATMMAVLAIIQYLLSNGRFLWVYAHPHREPTYAAYGTFANPNHLAHFVSLGIAPILWILWKHLADARAEYRGSPRLRRMSDRRSTIRVCVIILCLTAAVLAVCLSLSRGGLVVTLISVVVFSTIALIQCNMNREWLFGLIGAVIACGLALSLHGLQKVGYQVQTMSLSRIGSDRSLGARRQVWEVVLRGSQSFSRFGVGAGAHQDAYPTFLEKPAQVTFTHAESSYLQVLFEAGVPGLVLLTIALIVVGCASYSAVYRSWPRKHLTVMSGAVVASLSVSLVHATFDFVWHIPACMTLSIVLFAVVFRLAGANFTSRIIGVGRGTWVLVAIMLCVLAISNARVLVGPAISSRYWDEYLAYSLATNQAYRPITKHGRLREIGSMPPNSPQALRVMTESLQRVIEHDPQNAHAHGRLASLYLQTYDFRQRSSDNAMGISQLRDAAHASNFETGDALHDWLRRALGENKRLLDLALFHAKTSIRLCPMEAASYLYWSELAFLEFQNPNVRTRLLQQASLIRHTDGAVLFAIGQELASGGDIEGAFANWRKAFHLSSEYRNKLIETLSDYIPANVLVQELAPDLPASEEMFAHFRKRADQTGMTHVAVYAYQVASRPDCVLDFEEAVRISDMLVAIGRHEEAIEQLNYAADLNPHDYGLRIRLARQQIALGQFPQAEQNLRWCQRRRSGDSQVTSMLQIALRESSRMH